MGWRCKDGFLLGCEFLFGIVKCDGSVLLGFCVRRVIMMQALRKTLWGYFLRNCKKLCVK